MLASICWFLVHLIRADLILLLSALDSDLISSRDHNQNILPMCLCVVMANEPLFLESDSGFEDGPRKSRMCSFLVLY